MFLEHYINSKETKLVWW